MTRKRLLPYFPYVILTLLCTLLYIRTINFDFVYYDDHALILDRLSFLKNLNNIPAAFTQYIFSGQHDSLFYYYRPLLTVFWMFATALGDGLPSVYHATNLLFHCLAVCLLYAFLTKRGYDKRLSLSAAAIFAAHPALTQTVAWIPGLIEPLLAVFFLGSLLALEYWQQKPTLNALASHALLFAAALFTKETALALPPLVLLQFWLYPTKKSSTQLKTLLPIWIAIIASWLLLRHQVGSANAPSQVLMQNLLTLPIRAPIVLLTYLGKTMLPIHLSGIPVLADIPLWPGFLALITYIILALKSPSKRAVIYPTAWFLLTLTPSIIPSEIGRQAILLENRLYLSLIGVILFVLETKLLNRFSKNRQFLIAATLVVAILGTSTFYYQTIFKDPFSFWESVVISSPHNAIAHATMGNIHKRSDANNDRAKQEFLKAIELDPRIPYAHNNLGLIYLEENNADAAEREFVTELNSNPYPDALYNLGLAYLKQGRQEDALNMFLQTIQADPTHPDANISLAQYYYDDGDYTKAWQYYQTAQRHGLNLNFNKPPDSSGNNTQ